jgi:hypothetical protein
LAGLLGPANVDPGALELVDPFRSVARIDDMERFLSAVVTFFDKWEQDLLFFGSAVEERASVA